MMLGKKSFKKKRVNLINMSNPQLGAWDRDNPIKRKSNVEGHETKIIS
jgi:hypothetical protein